MKNIVSGVSHTNTNNNITGNVYKNPKTEGSSFNSSKSSKLIVNSSSNYMKSNKSIEKYISEKIKDLDKNGKFDDISSHCNSNKYINNYKLQIESNTSISSNTLSSNVNKNNICKRNNSIDNFRNPKIIAKTNPNKSINAQLITGNRYLPADIFDNSTNTVNSIMTTIPNNKETLNKSENNLSDLNGYLDYDAVNINQVNNIENIIQDSNSSINNPQSQKTFYDIKKSLIELVNETKDKSSIIRELDYIYKNILKVSNPTTFTTNLEEETNSNNLNITRSISNFNFNDNNLGNFNNISHVDSSTLNLRSSALNIGNKSKDRSTSIEENTNTGSNYNLNIENESLRKENKNLQKKVEEIDKKFEKIIKENDDLKGYVNKKTENIKSMEDIIKKFHNELNEVKKKQMMNNMFNKNNINYNKQSVGANTNSNSNINNNINTSSKGSVNKIITITKTPPKKILNKKLQTQNNFQNNPNLINLSDLNDKKFKTQTEANLDDSYSYSNTMSILSIDKLKPDDKNIYYYPTRFNIQSQTQKSDLHLIPKIQFKTFVNYFLI